MFAVIFFISKKASLFLEDIFVFHHKMISTQQFQVRKNNGVMFKILRGKLQSHNFLFTQDKIKMGIFIIFQVKILVKYKVCIK